MTVTPDSPWRNPPRISLASFEAILKTGNSGILAERTAASYWNYCINKGVDPLYIVAQFQHESNLGTAGVATQTKSWGNTRTPNFGAKPIGTAHGASGTFPIWRDWLDGMISTVERYLAPDWVYHNRVPIREIFIWPPDPNLVWAPAGDLNDPHGYLRAVIDFMNAHEESLFMAEIPGFTFVPETCGEFGYPVGTHGRNGTTIDRIIMHYTDGVNSLEYLTGCHGNSVHFLTHRDGTPRAQMIPLADAAWGAGNKSFNLRGVNFEIERLAAEAKTWPDELIENVSISIADICKVCNVPADREHIIGHGDVSPQAGEFHSDPGGFFPWAHFIDRVNFHMSGPSPIPPQDHGADPVTGKYIASEFQGYYDTHGGIDIFGRPVSGAFNEDGRLVQYFERNVMQSFPENQEPYKVLLRLLGTEELARRYGGNPPA